MTSRKFSAKDLQVSAFDPAIYLDSKEMMAAYLEAALAENDPAFLMAALNDVIRARGIAEVASKAGLGRESLYKTLKPGAEPRLGTVLRLFGALDVRLSIAAPHPPRKTKRSATPKSALKPVSGKNRARKQAARTARTPTKKAATKRPAKTGTARNQMPA